MSTKLWQRDERLGVDPSAITDLEFDAQPWLRGDAIASVGVVGTNCTASSLGNVGSVAKFRVSEVTVGAKVTLTIASASGRRRPWSWNLDPVPQ